MGLAILIAVALSCLAYAYLIEPNRLVIKHDTIAIKGWNPSFDGLRIAMLGDIHGGSNNVTVDRLREVVSRTNAEKPDLIVLLGDYVSEVDESSPARRELRMPVDTIFDSLAGLEARHGVFAVLGNHDRPFKAEISAAIKRQGYTVLHNEAVALDRDGQRLRILGLRDHLDLPSTWDETAAHAKAALQSGGAGDVIVLQHSPDILPVITGERLVSPDLKLFLAAHTHGGQVWMPILGRPIVPSSYGQKYVYGHVRDKNIDLYVTSGIGTSVLPLRFMVPPEIVILTIRAAE